MLLITGPPGVGKTWTSRVTAQVSFIPLFVAIHIALCRSQVHKPQQVSSGKPCTGLTRLGYSDGIALQMSSILNVQALFANEHLLPIHCEPTQYPCTPFLQISSYSFVIGKEEERLKHLMERLKGHLQEMPQSLIVFEDFDRFDCALRDFVRDVRFHPSSRSWTQTCVPSISCLHPSALSDASGGSNVRLDLQCGHEQRLPADNRAWSGPWAAVVTVRHHPHIQCWRFQGSSNSKRAW